MNSLKSRLDAIGGGGVLAKDLAVAASGYGHETYCPEGIPVEAALVAILGGFAASFGVLYTAITMITGAAKKKKRSEAESVDDRLSDAVWMGTLFIAEKDSHLLSPLSTTAVKFSYF